MEAHRVAKPDMAKVEDELVGAREQLSQARMEKADHDAAKLGQQGGVLVQKLFEIASRTGETTAILQQALTLSYAASGA